ncbi:AraC family transcriptional regulator [Paenibacillus sp. UNC451MF]|uniref:AraC family transcriptional regulator n=1 Tax=Paenibacillus sp. UNC451MF TaxID=1449063 RepID=UPI0012DF8F8C
MLNLNKSHLSRLFLRTTHHSIGQIAFDCGLNDINYFSKTFKESTGPSPLQ